MRQESKEVLQQHNALKSRYQSGPTYIAQTNAVLADARKQKYKALFIRHIDPDSKDSFAEGSENSKFLPGIHKKETDVEIIKYRIGSFYKTTLQEELEGVDEVVICGMLTNLCVRSLIEDAYDRNFAIAVIKDCCVALDKETQDFTFNDLKSTREEIAFMSSEEYLQSR